MSAPRNSAAQAMAGKPVYVVGGGNSAGQAAVHLSKYASKVTVLVRSHSPAASMSQYLIREIDSAANIEVRYSVEVAGAGGQGRLQHLDLRHRGTGMAEHAPAAGLFILIGARPFTEWLPVTAARHEWGYILTGPDARGLLAAAAGSAAPGDQPARRVRCRRRPARVGRTRRIRRGRGLHRDPPSP